MDHRSGLLAISLVASLVVGGCGSASQDPSTNLKTSCALIKKAQPASTYDAASNQAFAKALTRINGHADGESRKALAPLISAVDQLVATADEPGNFIDAHVAYLADLQTVSDSCVKAGAAPLS